MKKVIGTNLINQSIFFQKSLFLNHKIIKIYLRKLIPSFKGNAQLAKLFLITINLLYHFGRIQDSFLKADLEALPLTYSIPWHKINVYEKNLFKHNLNKFKVE